MRAWLCVCVCVCERTVVWCGWQMFVLLGDNATVAASKAAGVVRVETALAQAALPADDIRWVCDAVTIAVMADCDCVCVLSL